jgi:hypothetical protein
MTAKIIQLNRFRVGYRHWANSVKFPELHRVTGFFYDLLDEGLPTEKEVVTDRPAAPSYSLSADGEFGLANPTVEPIKMLSATEDKGWLIVRHHRSGASVDGYLNAIADGTNEFHELGQMVWQTDDGIFTVLHRPRTINRPDHLLVYVTETPIQRGPLSGVFESRYHIVFPDGTTSRDDGLLLLAGDAQT